jgi:hypothetical protein
LDKIKISKWVKIFLTKLNGSSHDGKYQKFQHKCFPTQTAKEDEKWCHKGIVIASISLPWESLASTKTCQGLLLNAFSITTDSTNQRWHIDK